MKFLVSVIFDRNVLYKKIDTAQTQRSVASDLFLHCLHSAMETLCL